MVDGRTCRAFSSALESPQSLRTVAPASLSVKRPSVATSATAPGDPVNKSANPSKLTSVEKSWKRVMGPNHPELPRLQNVLRRAHVELAARAPES